MPEEVEFQTKPEIALGMIRRAVEEDVRDVKRKIRSAPGALRKAYSRRGRPLRDASRVISGGCARIAFLRVRHGLQGPMFSVVCRRLRKSA